MNPCCYSNGFPDEDFDVAVHSGAKITQNALQKVVPAEFWIPIGQKMLISFPTVAQLRIAGLC